MSVEMMPADIVEHLRRNEAGGFIVVVQVLTDLCGAYRIGEVIEDFHSSALLGCKAECVERAKIDAGTADNNPVGFAEKIFGILPLAQTEECIGAHDDRDFRFRGQHCSQALEGFDGVVGRTVRLRAIDVRRFEAGLIFAEELDHLETIDERGCSAIGLERLHGCRSEQNAIECEALADGVRDREMAPMRWIEGSAEEADSHWAIVPWRLGWLGVVSSECE